MVSIKNLKRTNNFIILILCSFFLKCKEKGPVNLYYYAAFKADTSISPFQYFVLANETRNDGNAEELKQSWMKYNLDGSFKMKYERAVFQLKNDTLYQKIKLSNGQDTLIHYLFTKDSSIIVCNIDVGIIDKSEVNYRLFQQYEKRRFLGDSVNGIKKYEISNAKVEGYSYIIFLDSSFIPLRKIFNQASNVNRWVRIGRKDCPIPDSLVNKFVNQIH